MYSCACMCSMHNVNDCRCKECCTIVEVVVDFYFSGELLRDSVNRI